MNLQELKIAKEFAINKYSSIMHLKERNKEQTDEMKHWSNIEKEINKDMAKIILEKYSQRANKK